MLIWYQGFKCHRECSKRWECAPFNQVKHQKMSKCDNGDQVTRTNNVEEYFGNEKPPRDPQRQGQYLRIDAGSHHQERLWLLPLIHGLIPHKKNLLGSSRPLSSWSSLEMWLVIKLRLCKAKQSEIIPKYFLNQEVSFEKNNFRFANPDFIWKRSLSSQLHIIIICIKTYLQSRATLLIRMI